MDQVTERLMEKNLKGQLGSKDLQRLRRHLDTTHKQFNVLKFMLKKQTGERFRP